MKTRLQAAAELLRAGRLAEARTKLLKEQRLFPQSAAPLELLGAVASQMGRHEEAIGYLRRAAGLAPSAPGPHLNLGTALLMARHYEAAADTLRNAVSRWQDIPEGRLSYGNALLALTNRDEAADQYHAAQKLAPRQVGTCINLAIAFYSIRNSGRPARRASTSSLPPYWSPRSNSPCLPPSDSGRHSRRTDGSGRPH